MSAMKLYGYQVLFAAAGARYVTFGLTERGDEIEDVLRTRAAAVDHDHDDGDWPSGLPASAPADRRADR